MKKSLFLLLISVTIFSFSVPPQVKIDITVDFTGYSDANTVQFIDSKGKSTIFNSADGPYQTKQLKVDIYTINWGINPAVSSGCIVLFHYNEGIELMLPEAPGSATVSGVSLQEELYNFSINCR